MSDLIARGAIVGLCLAVLSSYAIGVFDVFCWFYSDAQCSTVDWTGGGGARIWFLILFSPIAFVAVVGLFTALE